MRLAASAAAAASLTPTERNEMETGMWGKREGWVWLGGGDAAEGAGTALLAPNWEAGVCRWWKKREGCEGGGGAALGGADLFPREDVEG